MNYILSFKEIINPWLKSCEALYSSIKRDKHKFHPAYVFYDTLKKKSVPFLSPSKINDKKLDQNIQSVTANVWTIKITTPANDK